MAYFKESHYAGERLLEDAATQQILDRPIGSIIAETCKLDEAQIQRAVEYQRQHGVRLGEAVVALGLASKDDVMFALAQQFHYPYAPERQRGANPELVALNQPFGVQSESFRSLRSQVLTRLFADNQPRRAVAIVSPDTQDGKTYCAANLAVVLAQTGARTLLVDADLRRPRQHEVFGLDNTAGLSGILAGRAEFNVFQTAPGVGNLFVLPVGSTPPNPTELVERPAFRLLMAELVSKFDHVVVDTPAACFGSDSAAIAARSGSALVIARRNASRVDALQSLVGTLQDGPALLAGVVFNDY